jgi:hypothetical protein
MMMAHKMDCMGRVLPVGQLVRTAVVMLTKAAERTAKQRPRSLPAAAGSAGTMQGKTLRRRQVRSTGSRRQYAPGRDLAGGPCQNRCGDATFNGAFFVALCTELRPGGP